MEAWHWKVLRLYWWFQVRTARLPEPNLAYLPGLRIQWHIGSGRRKAVSKLIVQLETGFNKQLVLSTHLQARDFFNTHWRSVTTLISKHHHISACSASHPMLIIRWCFALTRRYLMNSAHIYPLMCGHFLNKTTVATHKLRDGWSWISEVKASAGLWNQRTVPSLKWSISLLHTNMYHVLPSSWWKTRRVPLFILCGLTRK